MRAVEMKERPNFPLMRQTDVQGIYHMQMPRWLFSDPRYADMSLDAKVAYTFLLNRFQLSRRNGWANEQGEVFVIFPRKELAKELRICEKRVTAAFQTLAKLDLIWEKRCGRGDANQIYLAHVQPQDDLEYTSAPFVSEEYPAHSRTANFAGLTDEEPTRRAVPASQEPQKRPFKNRQSCGSRTAESAVAEPPILRPSYKEKKKKEESHIYVSPSAGPADVDKQTDDEQELQEILDACELDIFEPEVAKVFENAIERLFYSDSFRIGNATLPRSRVRSRLHMLDWMILDATKDKLRSNLGRQVKNSTAYTMTTIFNCIAESESDLLVDPYLNSLGALSGGLRPPGGG
ncbi:MAG: hypothetical protein HFF84_12225 [Oscillibacter sp.]|nr:hypothetical protein [Oscillibacter sp.]